MTTAVCSECGWVSNINSFEGAFLNPRRLVCRVRGDCYANRVDSERLLRRMAR